MQTDKNYWNGYYSKAPKEISMPSDFAKFVMDHMQAGKKLIDLGCGNGRDSVYFCNNGIRVTAVDSSKSAIEFIDNYQIPIFAVCDDFVETKALACIDYDYCYARWTIHAINKAQQNKLLPNVYHALNENGLLFVEVRTINDAKYGQGEPLGEHEFFFDNHYRRFIDPSKLITQIKEVGFEIVSHEESDAFSVVGSDAPTLLRLIAKKPSSSATH